MKRYALLALIAALLLALSGCSVDSYTGSITVINNSDKGADIVVIGNYIVGPLSPGGDGTIYYKIIHESAKIKVDGFIPPPGFSGAIDLRLNYSYLLTLYKDNGSYYFFMTAEECGQDDRPSMK